MNEDNYFNKKAEEIFTGIVSNVQKGNLSDFDAIKVIYAGLKEVARDQRYACIDAFIKSTYDPDASESRHISAIQNAQIEGEKDCEK